MRFIGEHKNLNLRQRQVDLLCDAILKLKNAEEIDWFLKSLLTPSELGYMAQRIDIMQQILQEKNYFEIKDEIGTSDRTITKTKQHLNHCDQSFLKLIISIKKRPKKVEKIKSKNDQYPWIDPHIPGAIRFK